MLSSCCTKNLNWQPKVKFEELVRIMVENDLKEISASKKISNENSD